MNGAEKNDGITYGELGPKVEVNLLRGQGYEEREHLSGV